jgi:glutamate synthase domain-containing protein 3
MIIDAKGMHYRELNRLITQALTPGTENFSQALRESLTDNSRLTLDNVNGQRYIGIGLAGSAEIIINGTPGNDLAMFMDGPRITVHGNAQDGVANTMNAGEVVVHGSCGDVTGYGMRGGSLFIRGSVGYRAGIHAKAYNEHSPLMMIGGGARDFLGEYMAGGTLIVLRLNGEDVGDYLATGMHGGVIYIRGSIDDSTLGAEARCVSVDVSDMERIGRCVMEFCERFGMDVGRVMDEGFVKIIPQSSRPYASLYTY